MIFQTAGHQFCRRLSVCCLLLTGDQSSDCGVSNKLYNASVILRGHTVIGEGVYTSGLGTQPGSVPELTLLSPDVQFAVFGRVVVNAIRLQWNVCQPAET